MLTSIRITEQQMVEKLIDLLESNTDLETLPQKQPIKRYIYNTN